MEAVDRSTDLLVQGLHTLAGLLVADEAAPEAMFARQPTRPADAPSETFYVPAASPHFRWYQRKQPGWYLLSHSRWDHALRLLGEGDLRVALLANGELSRHVPLKSHDKRSSLAHAIIDCAARYALVWPTDGPDLTELLVQPTS